MKETIAEDWKKGFSSGETFGKSVAFSKFEGIYLIYLILGKRLKTLLFPFNWLPATAFGKIQERDKFGEKLVRL